MRQSSNNHKVPTVILGEEETQLPPDDNPYSPTDWPSAEPNFSNPDFSQSLNHLPDRANGSQSIPARPPTRPPTRSSQQNEIVDLDADYWQQELPHRVSSHRASSQSASSQHTPPHREPSRHKMSGQEQSAHSDERNDDISDDLFFEDQPFTGDGFESPHFDDSLRATEELGIEPFEADGFTDDFADGFTDSFTDGLLEDRPRHRRPRSAQPRRSENHEENLNYLFGEPDDDLNDEAEAGISQRRNGYGHPAKRPSRQQQPLSTQRQLEKGLLKAAMAASPADYFKLVSQILGRMVTALPTNSTCAPSAFPTQLSALSLLSQRYGACGLHEQTLLTDAIELHSQSHGAELLPVLTGLATRVILKPYLDKGLLSPPLLKQLFSTTAESVKLLAIRRQLKALPGLIARLSRLPIQNRHALNQLPQQLDRAAMRVTQDPQLYQRLCRYTEKMAGAKVETLSAAQSSAESPQRLRINGPVEIFFRRLDDE